MSIVRHTNPLTRDKNLKKVQENFEKASAAVIFLAVGLFTITAFVKRNRKIRIDPVRKHLRGVEVTAEILMGAVNHFKRNGLAKENQIVFTAYSAVVGKRIEI